MNAALNITFDRETENGRVYPKDVLIKAVDKFVSDKFSPVLSRVPQYKQMRDSIPYDLIVGTCIDYDVQSNGGILFDVNFFRLENPPDKIILKPLGFGEVDSDGKIKDGYRILYLYM